MAISSTEPPTLTPIHHWLWQAVPYIFTAALSFWLGMMASNFLLGEEMSVIQKINFDYTDSPVNHGWHVLDADEIDIRFQPISNNFVGKAMSISSDKPYGIDFNIGPEASLFGRKIEYMVDLEQDTSIYALVKLKRDDGTNDIGWLNLKAGTGDLVPLGASPQSGESEWIFYVQPRDNRGGTWLLFQVNLEDAIKQTFGKDGWKFQELQKLRIRGKTSIDYMSILGKMP